MQTETVAKTKLCPLHTWVHPHGQRPVTAAICVTLRWQPTQRVGFLRAGLYSALAVASSLLRLAAWACGDHTRCIEASLVVPPCFDGAPRPSVAVLARLFAPPPSLSPPLLTRRPPSRCRCCALATPFPTAGDPSLLPPPSPPPCHCALPWRRHGTPTRRHDARVAHGRRRRRVATGAAPAHPKRARGGGGAATAGGASLVCGPRRVHGRCVGGLLVTRCVSGWVWVG